MLDEINLNERIEKEDSKVLIEKGKAELMLLEQEVRAAGLQAIILFEGWESSGKGTLIRKTISSLDPRSFNVYSTVDADSAESRMPLMWRFWKRLPEKGRIAIFDRSWYQETAFAFCRKKITADENERRLQLINEFERQLTDDGYLIIKVFLHISREEQLRRFKKLSDHASTKWRVSDEDYEQNDKYDRYYKRLDEMLTETDTAYAPWNIISAENKHLPETKIFEVINSSLRAALDGRRVETGIGHDAERVPASIETVEMPLLSKVELDKSITEDEYRTQLKELQKKLSVLHGKLYAKKIPVVICFEGWDAAGKGGSIRRISAALDPRGYEAVPIAAPDKHELARHYLWRFWNKLPKTGHIAIFDRTWYGRVMVERLEKLTPPERWGMAYREMNEFEKRLTEEGFLIIKFWVHIDKEEQLRRFTERQNTPEKQWKITAEDWRNREKWDEYEEAVDEMIRKTSTTYAPWHIIEGNDKKYARIKTLETVTECIAERLKRKKDGSAEK